MTFKYFVTCYTGSCGSESHEFIEFDTQPTEEELDRICWDMALENAASYGIYPMSEMPEDFDEDEATDWRSDEYSEGIEGGAVPYDAEKHDGYSIGGDPQFQHMG
jgi:hypothetical protein